MIAELNGETKAVLRHRRGVLWCPFCDRSRQDGGSEQRCDGCHAKFTDEAAEAPVATEAPATSRRRRAEEAPAEEPVEEVVAEEVAEEA
jgi:ribosomal protein L37AE/L43A